MKKLTIEDILNLNDVRTEEIEVKDWGGSITIRQMTAEARDKYEQSFFEAVEEDGETKMVRDMSNARAKLIASCVIDGTGSLMFKTEQQVKLLGQKSSKTMDYIFEKCQKLNSISDDDMEMIAGN